MFAACIVSEEGGGKLVDLDTFWMTFCAESRRDWAMLATVVVFVVVAGCVVDVVVDAMIGVLLVVIQ